MTVSTSTPTNKRFFTGAKEVKSVEKFTVTLTTEGTMVDADLQKINNCDLSVVSVTAQATITNQAGTSPTVQLVLKGRILDSGGDYNILGDGTENIDTAAVSIATASSTPVDIFLDTGDFDRRDFTTDLAIAQVIGGTSTPTSTGTYEVSVSRKR